MQMNVSEKPQEAETKTDGIEHFEQEGRVILVLHLSVLLVLSVSSRYRSI